MEPQNVRPTENKEETGVDNERAAQKSPGPSTTSTPRRAIRGRGAGRPKAEVPCSPGTNGATTSTTSSGRVLRDRSTRGVPVWRQSETGEDTDELSHDTAANRRRKPACPRRRRNVAAASSETAKEVEGERGPASESGEGQRVTVSRAPRGRRAQTRPKTISSRPVRGSPRMVIKAEPESESPYEGDKSGGKKKGGSEKKTDEEKEEEQDVLLGEEDPLFEDDPKDKNYQPQSQSGEEEGISSDEDLPFRDDLNDQSYDPKAERDPPKSRRRAPSRPREKKEKAQAKEKEKERETESETKIKTEGGEGTDVKLENEFGEVTEPPRKRGRRRKDDKSPRLPKRRKKPPVQYVRCEMEGCGTVLAHPRYLQHHIKYQHLLKKKYVCPHPSCGRLFRLQKQLLRHAKHHTDQRDYICEFCARAFKSSHNLAVHRMIHTGEKPLQCEICGFTCRQKASLNWHMKKHDADASYQFSCSICGKKFEKKDSVVAHKAKSHPEVLIAEALAANAGALITTPGALLEGSTGPGPTEQAVPEPQVGPVAEVSPLTQVGPVTEVSPLTQVGPVTEVSPLTQVGPVMVVEQDHTLHTMQVPVTLALPSAEEDGGASANIAHQPQQQQQQPGHTMQMPLQFVSTAAISQQQAQIQQLPLQTSAAVTQPSPHLQQIPLQTYSPQPQILHMTFRTIPQQQHHIQQIPLLSTSQQLPLQPTPSQQTQALPRPPNPAPNTQLLTQAQPDAPTDCRESLGFGTEPAPQSASSPVHPHPSASAPSQEPGDGVVWEGHGTGENGGGVWERGGESQGQVLTDSSDGQMQHGLM
ncbi:E3 ubiquitin-protein ligase ZFP91 [Chanos chanos]|uniref:E3 ubiquitin-protein ligase ZFP91 n=1 Tax=Chanos chanos TaxID=29144 RepID=A0A6J2WI50_CHACN|nr:E3 ubiquitin-protein ligase ZFP91-like [Chanos chanos]